jgi:hypothetical protein
MSRKWLVKYHPDKWHGLCEGEKEYGQVFQHSNKVMVMDKAMHQAQIFWGEVWTHPEMICTPRGIWHHPQKFLHPANYIYFDLIVSYLIILTTKFVKLPILWSQISPCRPRKQILSNFFLGLSGPHQAPAKASSSTPRYLSTPPERKYAWILNFTVGMHKEGSTLMLLVCYRYIL